MALSPEQMKGLERQLRSGDAAGALAAAEKTLATEPEPELHYFAAVAARYARAFDRAEAHLDELKRLQPDFGRAFQEQGHLLRTQGDTPGALKAFERACALNPALRASFTHRIALATALGDHAQATLAEAQLGALDALPQPLQRVVSLLSEGKLRVAE
jgi:tetratricopeptide (TPR) repeat protein